MKILGVAPLGCVSKRIITRKAKKTFLVLCIENKIKNILNLALCGSKKGNDNQSSPYVPSRKHGVIESFLF